jgi:hypothetical protein
MSQAKFAFDQRSYGGRNFRPRPEHLVDEESQLLVVATPWGPRAAARKAVDLIREYFSMAKTDNEATSIYQKMTCLSNEANQLRTAVLLANEALYKDENKQEFRAGVELFAASNIDNEFVWVQVGQPHVFLARDDGRLLPLGSSVDLSVDMSAPGELLPALPNQMLGIDPSLNLTMNSFRARPGDRLLLLSHSAPPADLYAMSGSELNMERITQILAQHNPDGAFWLGVIEIPAQTQTYDDISEISA